MKLDEDDWYELIDPSMLLAHVRKTSPRKLRLIACACLRELHQSRSTCASIVLSSEVFQLLKLAEEVADGKSSDQARQTELRKAAKWSSDLGSFNAAARALLEKDGYKAATATIAAIESEYVRMEDERGESDLDRLVEIREIISPCVREIIGNPFRPVKFNPKWRTESTRALAEGVYANRAFDRMPILADALEEAGCENTDLLAHCREHGHDLGCWAVDLILGNR